MRKRKVKQAVAMVLLIGLLGGCASQNPADDPTRAAAKETGKKETTLAADTTKAEDTTKADNDVKSLLNYMVYRPSLASSAGAEEAVGSLLPSVEPYTVEPGLSNVENLNQFYLTEEMTSKLGQNGFVVSSSYGKEFFEIYESNRYAQIPNFVTVDSLMHTYHVYFSYLLKNVEKEHLTGCVEQLSKRMLNDSIAQYQQLAGSQWENAAKRNVAFFTVGAKLQDDSVVAEDYVSGMVEQEMDAIRQASGISVSQITGENEDYTQYIPRGYYEGDAGLESYFRAMMWYGRMHFAQDDEEMQRSAVLMTKALTDDSEAYSLWEGIYAVTSFFAGASDDITAFDYKQVLDAVYGADASTEDLKTDDAAFQDFCTLSMSLPDPQINSIPIEDGEENTILGFRFMGQRFSIDASIMQKLIYSEVGENSGGAKRMLPDVLDVPAALGSEAALSILEENGATDYKGYSENLTKLKNGLSKENETLWSASLYAGWLNTLRPLLEEKGEGYPMFMQNEEWAKKSLECFAGSFTELKHDTVLYSKQVMAEMGGGFNEEIDDRGYVEPEPLVYARFAKLAASTAQGLKNYGMLPDAAEESLSRLAAMAEQLMEISKKELQDETLTEEEYTLIKDYGGNIEHFWVEAMRAEGLSEEIHSQEYPAALVVDIATDPNGSVLEAATGNPSTIYVVVKVDGKLRIASGSVYSFYQFAWPMDDRLTDSKWRQMQGIQPNEGGFYENSGQISQPEWTESYRCNYD